ncbi:hypothetical protein N657DRAFT_579206 [Parathielavia appendiculata]|uniref:Uncharacterized protein n=1 Tax=Parathielavia appendiculata TaxID=2587402 RepID=A0AAN6TVE2_9PEZI|nr:hypothetical protein N657DRAFT_579206 [Parathielavia appendiculata]
MKIPQPNPAPKLAPPSKEQGQNGDGNNPIVSLDPTTPLNPQPLIADILRTRYCMPSSVFLVESIERNIPVSDLLLPPAPEDGHQPGSRIRRLYHRHRRPMRTVRLLLGDGELCIQAFCRGEIHRFVDSGSVFEGAYVRLDRFDLRFVDTKERGKTVYLVVEDMVTVGWNEAYMGILRREKEEKQRAAVKDQTDKGVVEGEEEREGEEGQTSAQDDDSFHDVDSEEVLQQIMERKATTAAATAPAITAEIHSDNKPQPRAAHQTPNNDSDDPDYISDSDSAFETLTISTERANQRRVPITIPDRRQQLEAAIIKQNQQQQQHRPSAPIITRPRPWLPTSATQPVKLTPLASIPHLPYRQNWMINVLAIVVSLAPVEPSYIAPSFRQRTARLADPSTPDKHILLTVYLDPDEFLPEVGSAVLLLGVKNHLYEGGSLRKYVSDGLVGRGSWWVQRVDELGWCQGEVERLRAWWEAEGRGRGS